MHIIPYFSKHPYDKYQHMEGWYGETALIHMSKFEKMIDISKRKFYKLEAELAEIRYLLWIKSE